MRRDYFEVVRKIRDRRIALMGCFVFGFDHDTLRSFDETVEFVLDSHMDLPRYAIAVPFPGTALYRRLKGEGRITTENWSLYDGQHVVFEPKNMTAAAAAGAHAPRVEANLQLRVDLEAAQRIAHAAVASRFRRTSAIASTPITWTRSTTATGSLEPRQRLELMSIGRTATRWRRRCARGRC